MTTAELSIDSIAVRPASKKITRTHIIAAEDTTVETLLPAKHSFAAVDLWKIRNAKRHFSIYRNTL